MSSESKERFARFVGESPEQQIINLLSQQNAGGMQAADITEHLSLPRDHRAKIRQLLKKMVRRGMIVQDGRLFDVAADAQEKLNAEEIKRDENLLVGRMKVTHQGYAFVDLEDIAYDGILVEAAHFSGAIDGDLVGVELFADGSKRRRHGRIAKIYQRGRKRIVGTFYNSPLRIEIDDSRLSRDIIFHNRKLPAEIKKADGMLVSCDIVDYPNDIGDPIVVDPTFVLGPAGTLSTEVERILYELGVPQDWPSDVSEEASVVREEIEATDLENREDLRALHFLTIDPETAKDYDDAVFAEKLDNGKTRVWVAVADVSHYVLEDSALDVEARMRGCSVYLPGRAIPMLPDKLSSNICSLMPKVDRLAMVVRFDLDDRGQIDNEEAMAAVINSKARFDYPGVAAALGGDFRGKLAEYEPFIEELKLLDQVSKILRKSRAKRGSLLALDLPEAKVVLDQDDPLMVRDIVAARSDSGERSAYAMIEEMMVAANEAVARIFESRKTTTIYRVHQVPRREAIEKLVYQLSAYGIVVEAEQIQTSAGMNNLLAGLKNHPAVRPLSYLALRALCQADYRVENMGHFGLASTCYLHFTSPIRRYPDLHVHRLLKVLLRAEDKKAGGAISLGGSYRLRQNDEEQQRMIARESSECERRAMDVERKMTSLYSAALMQDRIGDEFEGMIISMSNFGIFVGVDEPHIEGMIRIDALPGQGEVNLDLLRIEGNLGGPSLRLGDRVQVKLKGANLTKRQIDFDYLSGGVKVPFRAKERRGSDRFASSMNRDRKSPFSRGRAKKGGRSSDSGRGRSKRKGRR